MLITAITPQKKAKSRFNIFVDGQFAFALDTDNLLKYGLHVNKSVTQEEIQRLIKEDEFAKAYNKILNYLSFRPRSKKELTDYLHKQEVGAMTEQQVMKKLEELKLVNDEEFTRWFISQRQSFRPKGKRLLELELRQKGISQSTATEILAGTDTDESQTALKLVEKKLSRWSSLSPLERRQKIQGFLGRRGYAWDIIKTVLGQLKLQNDTFDGEG